MVGGRSWGRSNGSQGWWPQWWHQNYLECWEMRGRNSWGVCWWCWIRWFCYPFRIVSVHHIIKNNWTRDSKWRFYFYLAGIMSYFSLGLTFNAKVYLAADMLCLLLHKIRYRIEVWNYWVKFLALFAFPYFTMIKFPCAYDAWCASKAAPLLLSAIFP